MSFYSYTKKCALLTNVNDVDIPRSISRNMICYVCKWCTLLNTAVLCEMHVRERSEEEEVKTLTRTYSPHQTMLPQWGLNCYHAVGIKYSAGITLPWLKVTVDNKRREQSWESATFQLINISRRLKPHYYFISDSPLRRNFIPIFTAQLDTRYREQLATNKILSARLFSWLKWNIYFCRDWSAGSVMLLSRNYSIDIIGNSHAIGHLYISLIRRTIR